jgi:two-component system, OmpR family, response regulator MprA
MAKVLVIDDDPDVRKAVCRILKSAGHEVIEAHHGAAGMVALQRDEPDLVLTDLVMPGQDGIETIVKIREKSGLPIIAMSGHHPQDDYAPLLDAQLMGADLTITKPFSMEALLAAVSELLAADEES